MQYFSKKKLGLPEGYFVNSSKIPLAKEVNKLLANCGCETFPMKSLSEAIQKSNFFFTIQSELKNKLYGFVRVTSDKGLNANLWNLSAASGSNQPLFYSILLQVTLEKIFEVISKEYILTKSLILEITGKNKLLESDKDLKSSVSLRNKTIIPLGFLQVSLLRRLRDQTRQPPISEFVMDKDESRRAYSRSELLRGALLTINGIAAGMRNTG